jgi:tetratricopeptide (TPR) repeat protein
MKALEKDRNRRYESASAFAADVQCYLNDESVQACPPSTWYRFRKFFRRNKTGLGIVGLVLFFVVLLGGGAGWGVRDRAARQAKLNLEMEHALDEAAKAREQALTLTDKPALWKATLAEAASALKRAEGLRAQDEMGLEPATWERLRAVQARLDADETDRRFAARFEEVLFEEYEVLVARRESRAVLTFSALKENFQRHYGIEVGATPAEQAASTIQQRSKPMQDILLATLDVSLDFVPKEDRQTRQWLATVLDRADTAPWRKRAQQAFQASDWKTYELVFEEAVAARQPPSLLDRLAAKTPWGSPVRLKLLRRFRQAYPGDFWANHSLAGYLHYALSRPEEAIRYYVAALALRPHNPVGCFNLGSALMETGDLDGAIAAFREALDGHPDYGDALNDLAWILVTCPHVPRRDPAEGVKLAQNAVELVPNQGAYWNTLGVAHYRAGHWNDAVMALTRSVQLRGGDSYDWFFLAMARWQLGEKEKARQYFDQAVQWMDKYRPGSKELGRFHAEAAELIKVDSEKH